MSKTVIYSPEPLIPVQKDSYTRFNTSMLISLPNWNYKITPLYPYDGNLELCTQYNYFVQSSKGKGYFCPPLFLNPQWCHQAFWNEPGLPIPTPNPPALPGGEVNPLEITLTGLSFLLALKGT